MKTRIDLKVNYKIIDDKKVICYVIPIFTEKNPFHMIDKPQRYKGCAIRKPNDDCNIQMAKEIAKKKAMRAAYRDIIRKTEIATKREKIKIARLDKYISGLKDRVNDFTNEIIQITKEN